MLQLLLPVLVSLQTFCYIHRRFQRQRRSEVVVCTRFYVGALTRDTLVGQVTDVITYDLYVSLQ